MYKYFSEIYFKLGLKPTCISYIKTKFNQNSNILKTPCHFWKHWQVRNPVLEEVLLLPWKTSTGIGTVLGYNNRCIDIDNCSDYNLIEQILKILHLPKDYEWVVKTPNGFHIHLICDNLPLLTNKELFEGILSLKPNTIHKHKFERIELRWANHVILPPTIINGKKYKFTNSLDYPKNSLKKVDIRNIFFFISKFCGSSFINELSHSLGVFMIGNKVFEIASASNWYHCHLTVINNVADSNLLSNFQNENGFILKKLVDKKNILGFYEDESDWNLNKKIEKIPFFFDIKSVIEVNYMKNYECYPRLLEFSYSIGKDGKMKNYLIKQENDDLGDLIEIESLFPKIEKKHDNPIVSFETENKLSLMDSEYLRLIENANFNYKNTLRDGSQTFCIKEKSKQILKEKAENILNLYNILFDEVLDENTENNFSNHEMIKDCFYLMVLFGYVSYNNENGLI